MLNFIFGRSGFGKTQYIYKKIFDLISLKYEKILLIVPEQKSFETEKAILNRFGPKISNKVEITSFSKLFYLVSQKSDSVYGKYLSNASKNIVMSLVLENISNELNIYKNHENKIEFIQLMISAITEFKICSVSYEDLLLACDKVINQTLKNKLKETSLILESFNKIITNRYLDPLDDLDQLYDTLKKFSYFSDYIVFVDGFDSFTAQQFKIIEMILKQSNDCYISLCLDEGQFNLDKSSLFSSVIKTFRKLGQIAQKNDIAVSTYKVLKTLRLIFLKQIIIALNLISMIYLFMEL